MSNLTLLNDNLTFCETCIKQSCSKLVELTANGPVKKVSILSNQIAGVAIQEEQHLA